MSIGVNDRTPPIGLRRQPAIVARHAAQQAIGRVLDRGISGRRQAEAAGDRRLRDRIEAGRVPRQACQVGVEADFAPPDRMLEDVLVIHDRKHGRNLLLIVQLGETEEVKRPHVEIAAVAATGEVKLGQGVVGGQSQRAGGLNVLLQAVVLEIGLVREQRPIPAPHPLVREIELARGLQATSPVAITGRREAVLEEYILVELANARGTDEVGTAFQPLAPLALQQRALSGGDHRCEREVVVRCQRPIVGNRNADAKDRARAEARHQHAGLALHRRVGCGEIWNIGERYAEEFEPRVLEIHHLLALIVDDAGGFDLPFRRLLRVVLARLAGGVDAAVEDRVVAARALAARGRKPGLLGALEPQ